MTVFDGIWKRVIENGLRPLNGMFKASSDEGETLEESLIASQAKEIERLKGIVANTIKYPPEPSGLPVLTERDILFAYRGIIKETYLAVGMQEGSSTSSTPCFMNTYMPVIKNIIGYYHLLPASEYNHHNEAGGLLRHSLEVALMTLRYAKNSRPEPIGYQDIELLREPRWRFAAWLCGLLHDGGKIIYDMRVIGKETPALWNPQIENIFDFSAKHRIEKIEIQWRAGRINKYHENLSIFLMDSVLNDMSKRWLTDSNDNLYGPISEAMSFYSRRQDGYLETALRKADNLSAERDMKVQYHDLLGERRTGLAQSTINALRWCRKNQWTHLNNNSKARYFIIDEEVYIERDNGLKDVITKVMEYEKNKLVSNLTTATRSMEESGIIEVMHEESDFALLRYKNETGKLVEANVIRLSYPRIMFEDEVLPPNMIDCELILSQNKEVLSVSVDGAVAYKEIQNNPFKTLYNTTERVERNPHLTMSHPELSRQKKKLSSNTSGTQQNTAIANKGNSGTSASGSSKAVAPANPKVQSKPAASPAKTSSKPANKPATKSSNAKPAVKPSVSPIKFENDDSNQSSSPADKIWSGMNIGQKPTTEAQQPASQSQASLAPAQKPNPTPSSAGQTPPAQLSISPSRTDGELEEPRQPSLPSMGQPALAQETPTSTESLIVKKTSNWYLTVPSKALANLPNHLEKTLVYLVAKGMSDEVVDLKSILAMHNLDSLHIQVSWIDFLLSDFQAVVDAKLRTRLFKGLNYSSLGGGEVNTYLTFTNVHVRALAELLNCTPATIYESVAKVNHFGRVSKEHHLDNFSGRLRVLPTHEFEIINSELARTLGLAEIGVITNDV
ncbi:MobH family relaxase (plasmid) [Vibrio scophthalmi]|uniref:MobH family relaxase n=1 Tax=Vibrio scophthalmi TaxID=45658 RepID=UPI003EC13CBC